MSIIYCIKLDNITNLNGNTDQPFMHGFDTVQNFMITIPPKFTHIDAEDNIFQKIFPSIPITLKFRVNHFSLKKGHVFWALRGKNIVEVSCNIVLNTNSNSYLVTYGERKLFLLLKKIKPKAIELLIRDKGKIAWHRFTHLTDERRLKIIDAVLSNGDILAHHLTHDFIEINN